jgi:predicted glycogen debranching enzyme
MTLDVAPLDIHFGPATCSTLEDAASREWLVADGCGGYAMGTVSGLRTRRYHGLLVAAQGNPSSRRLALASLDPTLVLASGVRIPLGVHEWASGAIAPQGHHHLQSFRLELGLPVWRWQVGDVVLERTLAMDHGSPRVAVVHRLVCGGPVRLELEALCTWRDSHGERRSDSGPLSMEPVAGGVVVEDCYRLDGPGWTPIGQWYEGVRAREEEARGLWPLEDLWCAGRFEVDLRAGDSTGCTAWVGSLDEAPVPAQSIVEAARRRASLLVATARDGVEAQLMLAADSFIVEGPDVVAGYPWFGTWSRDTMTSYEGLFLDTGRADEGRRLLERYAATLSEGMLANTADTGATEFNTVDATVWFGHAVGRHVLRTGDHDLLVELSSSLDAIVDRHLGGTRFGIEVDPEDGLLRQGEPGFALTWMDARVDGVGVTARTGKPVEVNALWLQTLRVARLARQLRGAEDDELRAVEELGLASFGRRFAATGSGLLDVVDGPGGDDPTVRPNQLLAVGLVSLIDDDAVARAVMGQVADQLLTPLGLRSQSPYDEGYRGRHRGSVAQRDTAYHTGTVWPWLIGPYVDAALQVGRPTDGVLDGLVGHLSEAGLGSVSETADGDAPHGATGCPFQAWSVAELLRSYRRLATTE